MGMIGNSLAQGLISGANIQDGTVDTPDIKDGAIHTAKVADDAVHTAKIADDAVHTAKIADGAVTAAKIADGAAVPSQTGQSGKYLTTDGTTATWGTVDLDSRVDKTGDTMTGGLTISDNPSSDGLPLVVEVDDTFTKEIVFDESPGGNALGSFGGRVGYDADENYLFLGRTNGTATAVGRHLKLSRDTGALTIGGNDTGPSNHHGYGLRSYGNIDLNGAELLFNSGDAAIAERGSGTYGLDFKTYNATDSAMRTKLTIENGKDAPAVGYYRGQPSWYQAQGPWSLRGAKWNRVAYIDHRRAYELIVGTHGGWYGPGHICMHMSINYSGAAFALQTISSYSNYVSQVRFTCNGNGSGGGYLDIFISSSYDENGPSFHIRPLDGGTYDFVDSQTLDPSTLTYTATVNT